MIDNKYLNNFSKISSLILTIYTIIAVFSYSNNFNYFGIDFEFFNYDVKYFILKVPMGILIFIFSIWYISIEDYFKINKNKIKLFYTRFFLSIIAMLISFTLLNLKNNVFYEEMNIIINFIKKINNFTLYVILNIIKNIFAFIIFNIVIIIWIYLVSSKKIIPSKNYILNSILKIIIINKKLNFNVLILIKKIKRYIFSSVKFHRFIDIVNKIFISIYIFIYAVNIFSVFIIIHYQLLSSINFIPKLNYPILKQENQEDKIILFKVNDKIFISDFYVDENNICTIYTKNYEIKKYENIKLENRTFKDVIIDKENLKKPNKNDEVKQEVTTENKIETTTQTTTEKTTGEQTKSTTENLTEETQKQDKREEI